MSRPETGFQFAVIASFDLEGSDLETARKVAEDLARSAEMKPGVRNFQMKLIDRTEIEVAAREVPPASREGSLGGGPLSNQEIFDTPPEY